MPSLREMKGVPAGSAMRAKEREGERERERATETQRKDALQRSFFLKANEALRAERPLGAEAMAWRRLAASRSAMRMRAVPG